MFRKGTGPAVIVMAEIPGITPKVADFARRVVDAGFTVVMPVLFGTPGAEPAPVDGLKVIVGACVSKEFAAFATNRTAPVSRVAAGAGRRRPRDVRRTRRRCGRHVLHRRVRPRDDGRRADAGAGAEPAVAADRPLPKSKRALQLAPDDLARVKERAADGVCVLGLRFTGDILSPGDRFARLRDELGDAFIGVEIDSSKGNQWGIPKMAHSVLTEHLVDEPGSPDPGGPRPGARLLPGQARAHVLIDRRRRRPAAVREPLRRSRAVTPPGYCGVLMTPPDESAALPFPGLGDPDPDGAAGRAPERPSTVARGPFDDDPGPFAVGPGRRRGRTTVRAVWPGPTCSRGSTRCSSRR